MSSMRATVLTSDKVVKIRYADNQELQEIKDALAGLGMDIKTPGYNR